MNVKLNIFLIVIFAVSCGTFHHEAKSKQGFKGALKQIDQVIDLEIYLTITNYSEKMVKSNIGESFINKKMRDKFDVKTLESKIEDIRDKFIQNAEFKKIEISDGKTSYPSLRETIKLNYIWDGEYDKTHYSWQWLTTLTVGIIPFWQRRTFTLHASVMNRNGQLIGEYKYIEYSTDIKHLLLLPLAPFFIEQSISKKMIARAENKLLIELKKLTKK